jgi:hypothetical protein
VRRATLAPLPRVSAKNYWQLGSIQAQIHDSESLTLRRPIIVLLASFGGLALVLVVGRLWSYIVLCRRAHARARPEIAGLVIRESMSVTFAGLAIGTFCAYAMSRFFPDRRHRLERIGNLSLRRLPDGRHDIWTSSRPTDQRRDCRVVGACAEGDASRSDGCVAIRVMANMVRWRSGSSSQDARMLQSAAEKAS